MTTPEPAVQYALRRFDGRYLILTPEQGRELEAESLDGRDVILPGERLVRRATPSGDWEEVAP